MNLIKFKNMVIVIVLLKTTFTAMTKDSKIPMIKPNDKPILNDNFNIFE